MHNRICVKLMKSEKAKKAKLAHHRLTRTEKNVRYCDSLSHRRMMHNRTCVKLMKSEKAKKRHQAAKRHKATHRRR
jgi:hypothetical protein